VPDRGNNLIPVVEVDLTSELDGYADPVVFGVALDGSIYAIARKCVESLVDEYGLGVLPKSQLTTPVEHIVVCWRAGKVESVVVASESLVGSYAQPHPEGVLLVGSRCHWKPQGPETNAVVIDRQGRIVRRMTLGDGIEDVRVSPDGTIWVSYFDEGVFGNYGWSDPGPTCIGAPGLVAFTPTGEIKRRYQPVEAGTDDICDAYAVNVTGNDDVWVYFYVDFPIVNLRQGAYRVWDPAVAGARALAIKGERVLLLGDYREPDLAYIVELGAPGRARQVQLRKLVDDRGQSLGDARCVGVGSNLYVFNGRKVLVVRDW
jgi:hypothetical protein